MVCRVFPESFCQSILHLPEKLFPLFPGAAGLL